MLLISDRATGVLHVGGGLGQEAERYAARDLPVIWVEPLAENVRAIRERTRGLPLQRTIQALVSDRDGELVEFHVTTSSRDGRTTSSSMLPLAEHRERFPHVTEQRIVPMRTCTVATLLDRLDAPYLNHMVVDVQGAELKVLTGAEPVLHTFNSLLVEGSTTELYRGQPPICEIQCWLEHRGFTLIDTDRSRPAWHTDYLFARRLRKAA